MESTIPVVVTTDLQSWRKAIPASWSIIKGETRKTPRTNAALNGHDTDNTIIIQTKSLSHYAAANPISTPSPAMAGSALELARPQVKVPISNGTMNSHHRRSTSNTSSSSGHVLTPASSIIDPIESSSLDSNTSKKPAFSLKPPRPAMGERKVSTPLMPAFMVSAPGKVIVYGEHAVVHGKVRSVSYCNIHVHS